MTADVAWLSGPLPFCACCCEYVVQFHAAYFCEVCKPPTSKPKFPGQPARMALDKPISTTSGEA